MDSETMVTWLREEAKFSIYRSEEELFNLIADRIEALQAAVMAVVDAVRDYLPPDGISEKDFISRVIGAVDNPTINPVIFAIEAALQETGQ